MVSFEALRPLAAEEGARGVSRGEDIVLSKRRITRRRWATLPAIHSFLLAVCIMITVCRNANSVLVGVADNVRFGGALMAVKIAGEAGAGVSVLMSGRQSSPVYKIALGIEYDGSKYYYYYIWQRQNEVRLAMQEKLEKRSRRWK